MRDGEVLVLVEVRARAHAGYGGAAASIGASKQGRLARAAALLLPVLLRRHWPGAPPPVRFDVVAFEAGRPHWLRGAFWLAEHAPRRAPRAGCAGLAREIMRAMDMTSRMTSHFRDAMALCEQSADALAAPWQPR